jgi:predicted phosphoribosyltransferase
MQVAIACALRHGGETIVVAVPCASERAAYEVQSLLKRPEDRFVCPVVDPDFRSVGEHYLSFPQVEDEEVARLLGEAKTTGGTGSEPGRRMET